MDVAIELRAGAARLRIAPALGGRVTACVLEDQDGKPHPVLQPYPETHDDLDAWAKGGMYPLVPYNGRIRDSVLVHGGREWRLRPHGEGPHTLHGIAQRRPWQLVAADRDCAWMRYTHDPDADWPWAFEAELGLQLEPRALVTQVALRNTGSGPMPGGIGLHPYLVHDGREALRYQAGATWPFDEDYLGEPFDAPAAPVSPRIVTPSMFAAGEVTLFHPRWAGPAEMGKLRLQGAGALTQLVLHRPAGAPYVCVEPVSHVPDGFNLSARGHGGTGTRVLAPGQALEGGLVIRVG